jgi:hypothetical protein
MTREIKFRAMTRPPEDFGNYKFKSEMVFGTGVLYDPVNTWLIDSDRTKSLGAGRVQHIIKQETLGQFTGLHDKNGKEIYEGDIVRTLICFGQAGEEYRDIVVQYDELGQISIPLWVYNESKTFLPEVIGNTLENKEPLE